MKRRRWNQMKRPLPTLISDVPSDPATLSKLPFAKLCWPLPCAALQIWS
jgi:hypothetical protein